ALHMARPADVVRTLLSHGADPNVPDYYGKTPLHIAAGRGDTASMASLLAFGAWLEARDRFGASPLHNACKGADPPAINLLLDAGADMSA
ncbi:ankyrin repeat-containing domain protein, partial [Lasiosphaeria miniovina]